MITIEKTNNLPETDARHHALNLSKAFTDLAEHARQDVRKVDDRRGKVLFELSAEVLLGLAKGMNDFAKASEEGMR